MPTITAPEYVTRKAAAFLTKAGAPDASPDQLAADMACANLSRIIGEPVIIARAWHLAKGA